MLIELASYGALARFRDVERMTQLGETTLMGTSGDISDLQFTANMLKHYQYGRRRCAFAELCVQD